MSVTGQSLGGQVAFVDASVVYETNLSRVAEVALDIGRRFGIVQVAPLGTGADDEARMFIIEAACLGKFDVIQMAGTWYRGATAYTVVPVAITTFVRDVSYPATPDSPVYRVPVGSYFTDNKLDIRVWWGDVELTFGTDFTSYYNGRFNTGHEQPLSVRDVSSGIVLTTPATTGVIRLQWLSRFLPIKPSVVSPARFVWHHLVGHPGAWVLDTQNPWVIGDPDRIPNGILMTQPPMGYVPTLWRFTRHKGGLTPKGKVGHGARLLPYLRGPQDGVAETDALVMTSDFIKNIGQHRVKFRVCWYNPHLRCRSLFADELIVINGSAQGDRHNGAGMVRARNCVWIAGT